MEQEVKIEVQGELVVQTTSTIVEFDKEQYLAEKLKELEDHNAGVEAYIAASNIRKTELETLINKLTK
jgi:cell division FtsZ-interacting protein ZapD